MEEYNFTKSLEDAINNQRTADHFRDYPEKVKAVTEKEILKN